MVFTPTAPFPASPSHPAAPAILSTLKATQKGYADMRGIWSRKCLETQGKRFIDRADTVDSIVAGKDFGRWLELLLSVADVSSLSLLGYTTDSHAGGVRMHQRPEPAEHPECRRVAL